MINMEPKLPNSDLRQTILNRIEAEQVSPRSAWFFSSKECLVWALWFFTAMIGAIAVAVSLSAMMYSQYSFFEITHGSLFWFLLEVLPYVWLLVFVFMAVFAVYNIRHTKHGYRYPLWQILASSLALSLSGGLGLHLVGAGFSLDERLGSHLSMYESQGKRELKMWQAPQDGRMVGSLFVDETAVTTDNMTYFTDVAGVVWNINTSELNQDEKNLLITGKRVRLIGHIPEPGQSLFYICGVFPWVYEKHYSAAELKEFKLIMQERMYRFKLHEVSTLDSTTSSHCVNTPLIKEMQNKNPKYR